MDSDLCGLCTDINATKSITGHGLSAAGTVEVIATLLQMQALRLHPSINLEDPLDTSFNWILSQSIPHGIEHALNLSTGFGGINTAKPLLDSLSEAEKDRIELLITCTESGIDFGKSLSTYIHHYLGLNRNCRLFEIKQACYSGTAGFQIAVNFIQSQVSPGGTVGQ